MPGDRSRLRTADARDVCITGFFDLGTSPPSGLNGRESLESRGTAFDTSRAGLLMIILQYKGLVDYPRWPLEPQSITQRPSGDVSLLQSGQSVFHWFVKNLPTLINELATFFGDSSPPPARWGQEHPEHWSRCDRWSPLDIPEASRISHTHEVVHYFVGQPSFNGSPTDYTGAVIHAPEQITGGRMAEQERKQCTNQSRDGTGAADHDQPYQFGRKSTTARPHPFSRAEFAHLLIVRGRVRAAIEHIDATPR